MTKIFLAATVFLAVSASSAFSADKAKPAHDHKMEMMKMTPAQREEMAVAHEKMAACLRSDKPFMDCHKEMMESCKMEKGACPMMGGMHGMMGKGKKHDHEKMDAEESEESGK